MYTTLLPIYHETNHDWLFMLRGLLSPLWGTDLYSFFFFLFISFAFKLDFSRSTSTCSNLSDLPFMYSLWIYCMFSFHLSLALPNSLLRSVQRLTLYPISSHFFHMWPSEFCHCSDIFRYFLKDVSFFISSLLHLFIIWMCLFPLQPIFSHF